MLSSYCGTCCAVLAVDVLQARPGGVDFWCCGRLTSAFESVWTSPEDLLPVGGVSWL